MTTDERERIAMAICCGEHGRCILADCDPENGEETACIALKGYHDKTIEAVLAALPSQAQAVETVNADLLAACKGVLDFYDTMPVTSHLPGEAALLDRLQAAIAKAEPAIIAEQQTPGA